MIVKYGADKGDERMIALTSDHPCQARIIDHNEYEVLRAFNMAMVVHESFLTDEERNVVFNAWKERK